MTDDVTKQPVAVAATAPDGGEPEAELAAARKKLNLDPNKLILPGAILIAALLVSGTLLYVKLADTSGSNAGGQQQEVLTVQNLEKWAKQIKLDTKQFNQCLEDQQFSSEVAKDVADGQAAGVEGTPTFYINGKQIVGALPYESFQQAIDQVIAQGTKPGKDAPTIDDDPALGSANAPVTMIVFSDYECPYCRSWMQTTFPSIKTNYIDTGKVLFVYRDFPLTSLHPGAQPAALAADCANAQGKFWEYHDKIFAEQEKANPLQ